MICTRHPEILPGARYTDAASGISSLVPGDGSFARQGRDPYRDFVALAKDLNVSGVDIDYASGSLAAVV